MSSDDRRPVTAALTAHENWLLPEEVQELYDLRRQLDIGWALSVHQREYVERLVTRARERRSVVSPIVLAPRRAASF